MILENAREHFASAKGLMYEEQKYSEVAFYHNLATILPDDVDMDTLLLAIRITLNEYRRTEKDFPIFIALVPQYVRQFATKEFAHEFRRRYNMEILGLTQEELPDVDYGINEVSKDIIDISNKDRNEVLAALYNASTPVGMGFCQYNPMKWNKEIAALYFEQAEEVEDGMIVFKWILGRPVSCVFKDNLVYVAGYNNDNEWGLAQRAIATCPNINTLKKENK